MKNLFSKNANLEDVVKDQEALDYHVQRFEMGYRYPLAKACYHYKEMKEK